MPTPPELSRLFGSAAGTGSDLQCTPKTSKSFLLQMSGTHGWKSSRPQGSATPKTVLKSLSPPESAEPKTVSKSSRPSQSVAPGSSGGQRQDVSRPKPKAAAENASCGSCTCSHGSASKLLSFFSVDLDMCLCVHTCVLGLC